ncbi:hypothetical protein KDC22_01415 [Paenibacillus tritici]|uniref:hypothetical protein n=1 Tax=Paenibacillus tritici TaxID=1873425 RepID=UPI001563A0B4|nr:hypothetical protein [Paenibacillus tritici]QUL55276.1 hypothetical protein KDC22_01415 [Paenibacillus tritici]
MKFQKNYILIIVFIDIIWLFSSTFNYDITIFKKSNFIVPIVLHIILFFWLGYKSKGRKLILFVILIILSFLFLIKQSFAPVFNPYSYEHLDVPGNYGEVIVEHRANLIDQGITEYRVYQTKLLGLFLTELTTREVFIEEPHDLYLSQKDIFNYSAPEWTRETVSFETYKGKLTLNLK